MTTRKIYIGNEGPFIYDDEDYILDRDGDFPGKLRKAFVTDGQVDTDLTGTVAIKDTNNSHDLNLYWNENDTSDRILYFLVNGANRTINLSGNLTIESASIVNQDLTIDASPTFEDLTVSNPKNLLQLLSYIVCSIGEVVINNGEVVWQS